MGGADPCGQFTVGGHYHDVTIGFGDGGDRVVPLARGVYNPYAIHIGLAGSGPASALEYNGHGWAEPSREHSRPHPVYEAPGSRPITPPAGWARPDHVGRVDHEHHNSVALSPIRPATAPNRARPGARS